MRSSRSPHLLALLVVVGACGGAPSQPTFPTRPTPAIPADDLATAKGSAKSVDAGDPRLAVGVKDPRVVDLDIIRIRATPIGVGGDPEMSSVATADLFRLANEAAKAGQTKDAIGRYRQIITEFPDSQYAPVSLFNIAAIYDGQGDLSSTITTLRELVGGYPNARESIEGHMYIAALQAEHRQFPEAADTLVAVLVRPNLTFADRVEANARRGYVLLELKKYDEADAMLLAAVAEWRRATRIDDPYYIAMANYYRGELAHRKFAEAPVRLPDDQLVADLETKRVLAVEAYDRWKESLSYNHAYWGTAAGYQMSQIFVELWEVTVKAPYPPRLAVSARPRYIVELHDRVRGHLEKALQGHRMNLELAKAYGVGTTWSKGSEQSAVQVMQLLAQDTPGHFVTPAN